MGGKTGRIYSIVLRDYCQPITMGLPPNLWIASPSFLLLSLVRACRWRYHRQLPTTRKQRDHPTTQNRGNNTNMANTTEGSVMEQH